jgi:hypothetical protein
MALVCDNGGRVDEDFVRYEFLLNGSRVSVDDETSLLSLTTFPHRSVCLEIVNRNTISNHERASASITERIFRRHLRRRRFQSGVDKGLWRLVNLRWPNALFAIGEVFSTADSEIGVNLNLELYPISAPTLQLWDLSTNSNIAARSWPTWFIDFITRHPNLVELQPEPYSPELLPISIAIARGLKQRRETGWCPPADITQVLFCLVECFRSGRPLPFEYPLAG